MGCINEFFILLMDDTGDVRSIISSVTFCRDMEGKIFVFGEPLDEEFEESINIRGRDWSIFHRATVVRI